MCVYGKKFGLYGVCVSFTLCWLSLQGGLPGFKGFIGKVVYPPFLLCRFYLGFKLGIFFIKFSLLPGLYNKNIIFKKKKKYLPEFDSAVFVIWSPPFGLQKVGKKCIYRDGFDIRRSIFVLLLFYSCFSAFRPIFRFTTS